MKVLNESKKISVIVPCYNVGKYLEKCLDSLINQTFEDYEIIIVNDGSTDNTEYIMNKYATEYPHLITGYTKENGGISSARNYGNERVNAQYITYIDSDDYVKEDFLEVLYNATDKGQVDIVLSGRKKVSDNGKILKDLGYYPPTILRRLTTHGVLYKKSYMEKNNVSFPEGVIYEDNPFSLVMIFMTDKIRIISYNGYYQLVRNNSLTAKRIKEEDLPLEALENAIDYISNNAGANIDRRIFEHNVISFLTYFIFQVNKSHLMVKKDRKSDIAIVMKICDWTKVILDKYFPECSKNPYIKMWSGENLEFIQKVGVWSFVKLNKVGLLKPFVKVYYRL